MKSKSSNYAQKNAKAMAGMDDGQPIKKKLEIVQSDCASTSLAIHLIQLLLLLLFSQHKK